MAQLRLNGLNFKELGDNSIEEVLNNSIEDIIKVTNKLICEQHEKNKTQNPKEVLTFRDFYEALDYNRDLSNPNVLASVEINSKNISIKRTFYTDKTRNIFNDHAKDELQERVCTENEANDRDIIRKFVGVNKEWVSIWEGELPFIYIYVVRVGNKEYSFYTVSR